MTWNFDELVVREDTNSVKYDLRKEVFGKKDIIPMWVADMDFKTPGFITRALHERTDHGIFGYSFRPEEYYTSIISWLGKRHSWHIQKEWINFSPGIVPALNFSTLAFTEPGDSIIVQPPVYFPFFSAVEAHNRKLVHNRLKFNNGRWEMDLENLKKLISSKTKMIIISNPHNPVGRAWTEEELKELAGICIEKNIHILSDEIHSDLVLPGHRHIPMAKLSEDIAGRTVTFIAPSKTFNLAGLSTSSVIISDPGLRRSFTSVVESLHIGGGNIFGTVASTAAYLYGSDWLDALLEYVDKNISYAVEYFRKRIPEIIPVQPEATYMVWLDCNRLGMKGKELQDFFVKKAGVGMNEGSVFGPGGEGFMRMNLATRRQTVMKAMEQIEKAVSLIR